MDKGGPMGMISKPECGEWLEANVGSGFADPEVLVRFAELFRRAARGR
jgi:hypothetical protein